MKLFMQSLLRRFTTGQVIAAVMSLIPLSLRTISVSVGISYTYYLTAWKVLVTPAQQVSIY
jgi:hypothetical protein